MEYHLTDVLAATASHDDAAMSLFMMKMRLGLAATCGGNAHASLRSAAPYAAPLTPPSSDCGGDIDDLQTSQGTLVQEIKGDVLSESEQVGQI